MATRERATKKTDAADVVEKKPRTRAPKAEGAAEKPARTRAPKAEGAAEKPARTRAPKVEGEGAVKVTRVPRASFNILKRRKAPADSVNDAVAVMVNAILNANPELSGVSGGQLNLALMGAGLAKSSADAKVLVASAIKAGTIVSGE